MLISSRINAITECENTNLHKFLAYEYSLRGYKIPYVPFYRQSFESNCVNYSIYLVKQFTATGALGELGASAARIVTKEKHYRERKCLFKPHNGPIKKIPCSGGSHRHEEPCNVNKPCLRKLSNPCILHLD